MSGSQFRHMMRLALTASTALAAVAFSGMAYAQNAANADGLDEIVVTAQKRAENIQDVPIAISAIGGGALSDASIGSTASLARMVPNVTINTQNAVSQPYIRGIGVDFANAGLETSNSVYLDDMYISATIGALFKFSDINRVEVLKGPQGTLYGRNATGGAIRLISNDPGDHPEASLALSYGRFDNIVGDAMVSSPLSEKVGLRASVYYEKRDGWVTNISSGKKLQGEDIFMPRLTLLARPSDQLTIKIKADYIYEKDDLGQAYQNDSIVLPSASNPTPGYAMGLYLADVMGYNIDVSPANDVLAPKGFYQSAQNDLPKASKRNWGLSGRIDYELEGVTLSSITGYRRIKNTNFVDVDATSLDLFDFDFSEERKSFQQELQAVSSTDGPLKWVAGLYFYTERTDNHSHLHGDFLNLSGSPFDPSAGQLNQLMNNHVKVDTFAPYAELTYAVTDKLSLIAGGRYTYEKKRFLGGESNNWVAGGGYTTVQAQAIADATNVTLSSFQTTFKRFTPKATVSYKFTPDIMAYATWSKGFKSGGFTTPAFSQAEVYRIKPEILTNYELGVRTQFGRVRWNTTAFVYKYDNLQVQTRSASSQSTTVENAAKATLYGVESELMASLGYGLSVNSGVGLMHSKYDQYANSGALVPGAVGYTVPFIDLTGKRLPRTPKMTAYLGVNYEHELAPGSGKIAVDLMGNYSATYNFDNAGVKKQPSYVLLSGGLGWTSAGDRFGIRLSGENLTDKKYYGVRSTGQFGAYYQAAMPRTWKLTASVKY